MDFGCLLANHSLDTDSPAPIVSFGATLSAVPLHSVYLQGETAARRGIHPRR